MFRDNLKEQIEYKGLIIKELAAKTGISKRTIDTYVDNRAVIPNAEVAVKLARALDTTVEYLVTGTEERAGSFADMHQRNYHKYQSIMSDLDSLPGDLLDVVAAMVHAAAQQFRRPKSGQN